MKSINVEYFAIMKDESGLDGEAIETAAESAEDLYAELVSKHNFSMPADSLKLVVNDEFMDWAYTLDDGDKIVFIPPVAGG